MREDAVHEWSEPLCEVCSITFGTHDCQKGNFGKLHIVEEYHLDGSHVIHIVALHYVYARLDTMQVMATLDDAMYTDPFRDAVRVLAHLGFMYKDGEWEEAVERLEGASASAN